MSNHVLLNNVTHQHLKVITRHSSELGDNIGHTITFPTELGDVQREYPVLFRKDPANGEFQLVALFGFVHDENLFLDEQGWNANYIPAIIARGPFLIGFQDQSQVGGHEEEAVIHVDMEHPRVSETEGEAVFLEHGGNSPYLERINSIMKAIYEGLELSLSMSTIFQEYDLIEPLTVDIELNDGTQYSLQGYYTINEEKLASLDGEVLTALNQSGFLQGAFLLINSLGNLKKLIDMKNARL